MKMVSFLECVDFSGETAKSFEGNRMYLSTGALQGNKIDNDSLQEVTFLNKPSRANIFVNVGDIVFAKMQGTIKVLEITEETKDLIVSTGFFVVSPKEGFDSEFLFQYLNSKDFNDQKDVNCTGATQKALTNAGLKKVQIPVFDFDVQVKIGLVLKRVRALIEKRKEQIAVLDKLSQDTFIDMFGDPVTNPMGWDKEKMDDITESRLGKMLDTKKNTGINSKPYLANFNVQWFNFELTKLNQMDFSESEMVEFKLKKGDLLVCEGGEVGRSAIWNEELDECYFQKALHRIRCNKEYIIPEYLAYWFWATSKKTGFRDIASSATIAHLTGVKLKALDVTVPPIEAQHKFAERLNKIKLQKSRLETSLIELETIYKATMQKAFNGELFY